MKEYLLNRSCID